MRGAKLDSLSPGPTLIERAYDAILGAIVDGRLPPSARLNQDELATRLGISRQPVGQALGILRSQGFVRDNGRRGLIVTPLEHDFFLAIYELREALDSLAATLAAQRCTPDDLDEGRRLLAETRAAERTERLMATADADMRFHLWICRVARNPLLGDTMRHYWNHLRRAMVELLRDAGFRRRIALEHQRILRAIAAHDPIEAGRHAAAHARDAGSTLARAMPERTALAATTSAVAASVRRRKEPR